MSKSLDRSSTGCRDINGFTLRYLVEQNHENEVARPKRVRNLAALGLLSLVLFGIGLALVGGSGLSALPPSVSAILNGRLLDNYQSVVGVALLVTSSLIAVTLASLSIAKKASDARIKSSLSLYLLLLSMAVLGATLGGLLIVDRNRRAANDLLVERAIIQEAAMRTEERILRTDLAPYLANFDDSGFVITQEESRSIIQGESSSDVRGRLYFALLSEHDERFAFSQSSTDLIDDLSNRYAKWWLRWQDMRVSSLVTSVGDREVETMGREQHSSILLATAARAHGVGSPSPTGDTAKDNENFLGVMISINDVANGSAFGPDTDRFVKLNTLAANIGVAVAAALALATLILYIVNEYFEVDEMRLDATEIAWRTYKVNIRNALTTIAADGVSGSRLALAHLGYREGASRTPVTGTQLDTFVIPTSDLVFDEEEARSLIADLAEKEFETLIRARPSSFGRIKSTGALITSAVSLAAVLL